MLVSEEQSLAIRHVGHAIWVAVPGSGKTRTLIAKTVAMIEAGYSNIGIVSFTKVAAQELKIRLEKELSPEIVNAHVKISTFHSMMLNHLRQYLVGTGLVSTDYETTHMLSILKNHNIQSHRLEDFRKYFTLEESERTDEQDFYSPWKEYLSNVLSKQHITLSNVVSIGTEMILKGRIPPLPFSYLCVDEFQDSDNEQIKLLLVHGLSGISIVCVGDDDQALYGFRNAKGVEEFRSIQHKLGANKFILSTNYRSYKEITDFANEIITRNTQRFEKTILSHKGEGGRLSLTLYKDPYSESESICNRIHEMMGADYHGDIFIIARTNAALDICRSLLEVPFVDLASKGREAYESQVLKTGLVALVQNNTQELSMMLSIYLPTNHARSVANTVCAGKGQQSTLVDHTQPLLHVKTLSNRGQHNDVIREFIAYATPHMLATCENSKSTKQKVIESKSRMQRTITGIEKILLKLNGTIKQRVEILSRQRKDNSNAKVKIMTVHGSKGLEAETVFLVGVSHKKFPSAMAIKEARLRGAKFKKQMFEEERRLLYVGATRAMEQLHVSAYSGSLTKPDANGYSELIPVRFIDNLPRLQDV